MATQPTDRFATASVLREPFGSCLGFFFFFFLRNRHSIYSSHGRLRDDGVFQSALLAPQQKSAGSLGGCGPWLQRPRSGVWLSMCASPTGTQRSHRGPFQLDRSKRRLNRRAQGTSVSRDSRSQLSGRTCTWRVERDSPPVLDNSTRTLRRPP